MKLRSGIIYNYVNNDLLLKKYNKKINKQYKIWNNIFESYEKNITELNLQLNNNIFEIYHLKNTNELLKSKYFIYKSIAIILFILYYFEKIYDYYYDYY